MSTLSPSARRVQEALDALGMPGRVIEMDRTTRSASDAATAVGCTVGQIVKSLVFKAAASGRAVLALTSGANRVDEACHDLRRALSLGNKRASEFISSRCIK